MFCRINLASWYLLNITKQLHIFREKFSTLTNQKLSLRSCDFSFNQPETFPKVMWFQLQPARNFPWDHVIWLRGNGSAVDVIFKINKSRNLRGNFKNSKYRKKKYFFGYVNTKIITLLKHESGKIQGVNLFEPSKVKGMYLYILSLSNKGDCMYPINVQTVELIGPSFFVGPSVTPGKVYGWSNFQQLASNNTWFLEILNILEILIKPATFFIYFCFTMYSQRTCSQLE